MLAAVVCLDLDRLTPTRRPNDRPISGYQNWRDLLFVHWRYPAAAVRALVPRELELDLYDDVAWVGLVPFEMKGIRLGWAPKAFGMDFLETNLRTYVHYRGEPGVFFFSLEASSLLAVKGARWGWSLPYFHASMTADRTGDELHYASRRRGDPSASLDVRFRVGEELGASPLGTFEHFLLERYYLFSIHRGRIHKGHVHHVPYPARKATVLSLEDGLIQAAGLERARTLPDTAHFSSGVDVEVFGPWPV